jgi:hypothetical protein
MKRFRPPKKLFGGRVRTSTVALSVLFAAVLALYLVVRPPPETGPSSRAASDERQEQTDRSTSTETNPNEGGETDTAPSEGSPGTSPPTETSPGGETPPDETSPGSGSDEGGSPANPPEAPPDSGGQEKGGSSNSP